MNVTGGCHCGAIRYEVNGDPMVHTLCHCADCRRHAGAPMVGWTMYARAAVKVVRGQPKIYQSSEHGRRHFCADCGTHLTTRRPGLPAVILKVGTLDDPALFGTPQMAIYTVDKQAFHHIPDGLPAFERLPKR